ncbi:helix-turn-helix transcriptional regulator [Streptomyces sedi]|uniref:Response regulator transcription factor n=1 Tax=Streptomyces sedi TaxID=555059 RepID=A0A5C4V8T2_9ACTN|nr:LuxR C-terminal-related transcriptional regulator [Streptomyces sedi]TNM32181.1 response regulator transcription factor [Streptomyces sedi]
MGDDTGIGLGLDKRAELVYRKLLLGPRWRPHELSRDFGWPEAEINAILATLRADGLASSSGDDPKAVRGIEPCVALPTLLARRMREANTAQAGPVMVERFVRLHERATDRLGPVTQGTGRDEASTMVERLITRVEKDIVFLVPGGSASDPADGAFELSRPIADMALRRGATVRSIWAPSALRSPACARHAQWLAEQEMPPRSVSPIPIRAMIMDGTTAVVVSEDNRARLVWAAPELEWLNSVAERLWERGMPVRQAAGRASYTKTRRPRSEIVLRLLAEGLTDDAIARRLGCSVRTVRNDVASAMTALNARSRFQAGVRAMQVGLI